jgi:predicted ester cyclase
MAGHSKTPDLVRRYVSDSGLEEHIAQLEAAFSKYEILVEDMLAERDMVVVRGTFRGLYRGVFAGVEPTGKLVSAGLMIIYRIENRRIAIIGCSSICSRCFSNCKAPARR